METLTEEIALQLKQLSPDKQEQVLQFAMSLRNSETRGEEGAALMPFFGILDQASGEEIRKAIDEHCEQIDVAQW